MNREGAGFENSFAFFDDQIGIIRLFITLRISTLDHDLGRMLGGYGQMSDSSTLYSNPKTGFGKLLLRILTVSPVCIHHTLFISYSAQFSILSNICNL
jgi:hypothetical protein